MSGTTASDVATIAPTSNRLSEIRDGSGVLSKAFTLTTGGDLSQQAVSGGATSDYVYSPRGAAEPIAAPSLANWPILPGGTNGIPCFARRIEPLGSVAEKNGRES